MSVEVAWENEAKTIIRYTYHAGWTWADVDAALATSNAMLDSVGYQVHFIVDMRQGWDAPSADLVSRFVRIASTAHPNVGITVVVGLNPFMRLLWNMVRRLYPRLSKRYRVALTVGEAQAILAALLDQEAT